MFARRLASWRGRYLGRIETVIATRPAPIVKKKEVGGPATPGKSEEFPTSIIFSCGSTTTRRGHNPIVRICDHRRAQVHLHRIGRGRQHFDVVIGEVNRPRIGDLLSVARDGVLESSIVLVLRSP